MFLNLMQEQEAISPVVLMNRATFNPSESLVFVDEPTPAPVGAGLTISHFSKLSKPSKLQKTSRSPLRSPRQRSPTFPNEPAKGFLKGQKIAIKNKPNTYNIMGECNLKQHFLKKLEELRSMKEEYYR